MNSNVLRESFLGRMVEGKEGRERENSSKAQLSFAFSVPQVPTPFRSTLSYFPNPNPVPSRLHGMCPNYIKKEYNEANYIVCIRARLYQLAKYLQYWVRSHVATLLAHSVKYVSKSVSKGNDGFWLMKCDAHLNTNMTQTIREES